MADTDDLQALTLQVAQLTRKVAALEDVQAVRSLHFKYGYYLDMCLYEDVVELFAEDAELRFLNGLFRGKAGVRRLYCDWLRKLFTGGRNGPVFGLLYDHLMLQDIVDVAPDGQTARGRFRTLMMAGYHESAPRPDHPMPSEAWEAGIYENVYAKKNGVWTFKLFNYNLLWQADYQQGWAHSGVHLKPLTRTYPDDPLGPDELLPTTPTAWPDTRVVPFHYPHPVTGKMWEPA